MKKMLFITMLFITAVRVNAQKLTVDELLRKINCETFDCFNDFLLSKGFSPHSTDDSNNFTWYIYTSDKFVNNPTQETETKNVSAFGFAKSVKKAWAVYFSTGSKPYYQELLKQFRNKGFVSDIPDKNSAKDFIVNYKSNNYPHLNLEISFLRDKRDDDKWTEYRFTVTRK